MIVTLTANVAIDRTYVVDRLTVDAVHKVQRAYAHTGGKGVNVSRCLHSLGVATRVGGMIGRAGLQEATRELTEAGIDASLMAIDGAPRQTVTVTATDGTATAFDEPGPTVDAAVWGEFEQHAATMLPGADMLVIAGSLPPGTPDMSLAGLCERANECQVPVLLDARGAAMRAAQSRNPLVAKLNRGELAQTLERELESEDEIVEAALALRRAGARHVVITLGAEGALGVGDDLWRVTHPRAEGNPIGAGDAFSAALAHALTQQRPFEQALAHGAAAALASLRTPTAGALDADDVRDALERVETQLISRSVLR